MRGILFINLGSPDSTSEKDIASYLSQFLMDPFVIPVFYPFRWFLVHCLIIPKRKKTASHAYKSIWNEKGSPLIANSLALIDKLRKRFSELHPGQYYIQLAMRYGKPSIENAIREFQKNNIREVLLFPLYPQYAESSTETAIQEAVRSNSLLGNAIDFQTISDFYSHPKYIQVLAEQVKNGMEEFSPDYLVFSYHGLPMAAVEKLCEGTRDCFQDFSSCTAISEKNKKCYRAQCFETTRLVAEVLGFAKNQYCSSFQSRLTSRWIQPFSDKIFEKLAKENRQRVLVISPSFVADCLETLEEIQIRARAEYKDLCGGELRLLPALNQNDSWVEAIREICLDNYIL